MDMDGMDRLVDASLCMGHPLNSSTLPAIINAFTKSTWSYEMRFLPLVAIMAVVASTAKLSAQSEEDRAGVREAVLDYVEGVYEVDPARIERSVHPKLTKIGYYRNPSDEAYREAGMTFEQLKQLAGTYNKDGRIPKDAPKEITVLDVLDKIATAKLVADWGVDYFQLAKLDGKWMIINVIWQSPPRE
jgi:hypothetical protein